MKITTLADAPCTNVKTEMLARVNAQCNPPQQGCGWWDPHNVGTYGSVQVNGAGDQVSMQRVTGDKKYTDKFIFTLSDRSGKCLIEACSESQVSSYLDFSTNYCNLEMMFCGSADSCKPVTFDFTNTVNKIEPMKGASSTMSDCLKKMVGDTGRSEE